jgi:hypothetical protein
MDIGFRFEVRWNDEDVFKVRVTAWNGAFGGSADAYVPIGGLTEAAAKLEGFPRQPSDIRELQFGAFGPEWAGGAANMGSGVKMRLAILLSKQESNPSMTERTRLNPSSLLRPLKQRRWIRS